MQKLLILLFLVGFAGHAHARVCFLPGVFGADSVCLTDAEYAECRGFDRVTPCPSGQEQVSCNKQGRTYYRCYCRADMYDLTQHLEYNCKTGYTSECGCAAKYLECTAEYKYEGDGLGHCKQFPNTTGVDACVLPSGKVWYKDCKCNENVYKYVCSETGLSRPSDTYACEEPGELGKGVKYYSGCVCATGWSANCNKNKNGCTRPMSSVYNELIGETTNYCYKCEEGLCPTSRQINMATYYCEFTENVTFDCERLGYIKSLTGVCPYDTPDAGNIGVKCPFDQTYIHCNTQRDCYLNKDACEKAHNGAICALKAEGDVCYEVSSCKTTGYTLTNGECVATACPTGFEQGVVSCPQAGASREESPSKSGGITCSRCVCQNPPATCIYTLKENEATGAILYAGNAEVDGECCNGRYQECTPQCAGNGYTRLLKTDFDENALDIETCTSCGVEYYKVKTCKYGYNLDTSSGRCVNAQCNTADGYSTTYQNVKNCRTSGGQYIGAYGWKLVYQPLSGAAGSYQLIASTSCTKCTCTASNTVCKWNNSNAGQAATLLDTDRCCNGNYKNCYAGNVPAEASEEACTDPYATAKTEYLACSHRYCKITACRPGYQVLSNRCH